MEIDRKVGLVVIGAGSAGLTAASIAAQLGVDTVLMEQAEMGGECLNTGCVPSKALLAAAHAAQAIRSAGRFGISAPEPIVDFDRVQQHIRGVIGAIAPHDSVERFTGLGVDIIRAQARFLGPRLLAAGNHRIAARRVIIATGSAPAIPPIPGLASVPFLTNETLFDDRPLPGHLLVIGGGPIGMEMAQAHRRLGAAVTVVTSGATLPRDEPDLTAILAAQLVREGVTILDHAEIRRVEQASSGVIRLTVARSTGEQQVDGTHLLVAAGRRPRIENLQLDAAGVAHQEDGITVDRRLRTSAWGIYAAGDVTGGPRFTHVAGYQASIAVRNALFYLPSRVGYQALPWVTFTDPELARTGMDEKAARARFGKDVAVADLGFHDNDRAQTERATLGRIKVVARRNGRILGASILGHRAGELIHPWVLAIQQSLTLTHMAGVMAPYPTFGEIGRMAAIDFLKPRYVNRYTRGVARVMSWLP